MTLFRRAVAEAFGTFGFVFIGCGVVVSSALPSTDFGLLGVALAHGVALAVMITATMHISGGHLNPAVTLGLLAGRRITPAEAGTYLVAQLAGASLGALLVRALMPAAAVATTSLGTPALQGGVTFGTGIAIEAVLTFLLVSAVYGTAVAPSAPKVGGFGIGLSLVFLILVGGPLTGAAANPARAFGPAAVGGYFLSHAVYWIGPVLGGITAGLLWDRLLIPRTAVA